MCLDQLLRMERVPDLQKRALNIWIEDERTKGGEDKCLEAPALDKLAPVPESWTGLFFLHRGTLETKKPSSFNLWPHFRPEIFRNLCASAAPPPPHPLLRRSEVRE